MPVLGKAVAWPTACALVLVALPALTAAAKPRTRGHFLTNSELGDVDTIACLKAKQQNPGIDCSKVGVANQGNESSNATFSGQLSAGNFPNYKDVICGSNGEYFCDPSGVFNQQERKEITDELQRLRRATPVTCSSIQTDKVDSTHLQPFYLGVVATKAWPTAASDPESLQQLGQIIESQWNMNELYVGKPIPSHKCANTGILIFMADKRLAYVSSGSCQFICQAQGGGKVVDRMLKALDSNGTTTSVLSGIDEVYRIVSSGRASPQAVSTQSSSSMASVKQAGGGEWMNPALQVIFALAIVLVVLAVLGAALVLLLAPGLIAPTGTRKSALK